MVKVSVIIPAYNAEQYIEKSIRSVMEQSFKDLELIVVNDASTDGTWDKICALSDEYGERMRGINLERNLRQGGARNVGIREARGEYLVFVDSDDWIEPDMVESFVLAIESENADLAGTEKYYVYYSDKRIIETTTVSSLGRVRRGAPDASPEQQYLMSVGGVWRNIFRRDIIIDNGIWFPEGVSYEDNYFVTLYLAYINKYVPVDKAFYYYRQTPASTVHRDDLSQLGRIVVEKMLYDAFAERGIIDRFYAEYEFLCIRRWYIGTARVYFTHLGKDAIKHAKEMAAEFKSYFPNYKKNKYTKKLLSRSELFRMSLFEVSPVLLYLYYVIQKALHHI